MGTANEEVQVRQNGAYRSIWFVSDYQTEKALGGADAEVGYELARGLIGYVGGYYFAAKDTTTVTGPKARVSYDLSSDNVLTLKSRIKLGKIIPLASNSH